MKNNLDIFLKGNLVDLCILDKKILFNSDWYKWFNDKNITKHLDQGVFPNTKYRQLDFFNTFILKKKDFDKKINDEKKIQLGIVLKDKKKLLGVISLFRFDYRNSCCEISVIINYQGLKNSLSIFRDSQNLMLDHAFNKMNFHRVQTIVYTEKLAELSRRLFNFKIEGILRKRIFLDGKYKNAYLLGLLKSEFKYK